MTPGRLVGGLLYRHIQLADKFVRLKVSYFPEYLISFRIEHDHRGYRRHAESHELVRIYAGFKPDGDEMLMHIHPDAFRGQRRAFQSIACPAAGIEERNEHELVRRFCQR